MSYSVMKVTDELIHDESEEVKKWKEKMFYEIIKNIDPSVWRALEYGANVIKETEQEIERTLNVQRTKRND